MQKQIVELLKTESNLTANQIADRLQKKHTSVKVILIKMLKSQKVVRKKVERQDQTKKVGPRSVYCYFANTVNADSPQAN